MKRSELVETFSQSVGVAKAESLVSTAEATLGFEDREEYTDAEVRDLCEEIQADSQGYVSHVANEIRVRRRAAERFETLLENVPDPAVVVRLEDGTTVVDAANAAFRETFGDPETAVEGASLASLVLPDDESLETDLWFRDEERTEREVRRETATGETRTYLLRAATAQRADGSAEGYVIYTDITEREQRERELRHQNEQLERFASVVSHDLRNPLNVASGRLELAREAASSEVARDHLEAVEQSHERMASLIDDLLTLARQGRTVGERERVDLPEVCRTAWATIDTADARLETAGDGMAVVADRTRLRELLQNLFRNAVVHAGPSVTVTVGPLDDARGFHVTDDGPGLPESEGEVFEYGYTTADAGTGFGLAIVESIAEAHGWRVTTGEGPEGGARFEFHEVDLVE